MADTFQNYEGDGSTNSWSVPFAYLKKAHVQLFIDGVEDPTFSWLTDSSIAASSIPADGAVVLVKRTTPRDALDTIIPNSGTYRGSDLNNQSLQALYVAEEAYDSLISVMSLDTTDNKWDADSKIIKNVTDPTSDQDAATKVYVDTKLAADVATVEGYKNTASSAATTATTQAGLASTARAAAQTAQAAAETAQGEAETSASAASTSASAAATSASAASTSASNASGSASTATTKASEASTSASNAATSATAAQTAQTAAETAQTAAETARGAAETAQGAAETAQAAAEAAYDSFDDRYLGAKSSAPTVDNDGNALIDGALYWDTTSNVMKVYDLGNTTWVAAYAAAVSASDIVNDSNIEGTNVDDALNNIKDSFVGCVMAWPTEDAIPYNALVCDGASYSTTTYADLYAKWGNNARFGSAGAGFFYVPDYRGRALRGHDGGAGVDPDAASRTDRGDGTAGDNPGTEQADAFASHQHSVEATRSTNNTTGGGGGVVNSLAGPGAGNQSANSEAVGGNETRMKNTAVKWIIFYK